MKKYLHKGLLLVTAATQELGGGEGGIAGYMALGSLRSFY